METSVHDEPAVSLPAPVEAAIVAHAHDAAPAECCGLLLGTAAAIVEARRARNVASDATRRYAIDPIEHLAVIRDARRRRLDVVGAYHSHPRSPARPSATDAEEAFSHFLFVIVGLESGTADVRGWRWYEGNFEPVPFVRVK
jgi:proteasome lid subunit RPN8/RPN11